MPCYVIHLDWGSEEAKLAVANVPQNPNVWADIRVRKCKKRHPKLDKRILYPGDKARLKAAKQAVAAKWFPFGYGPATGTSFVIEEIGQVSMDEGNYAEWREFTEEELDAHDYVDEDLLDGGYKVLYWFDEYQLQRTMKNDH